MKDIRIAAKEYALQRLGLTMNSIINDSISQKISEIVEIFVAGANHTSNEWISANDELPVTNVWVIGKNDDWEGVVYLDEEGDWVTAGDCPVAVEIEYWKKY